MPECYYKPCRELDICNELIEKYFNTQQYEKCFEVQSVSAELSAVLQIHGNLRQLQGEVDLVKAQEA